MRTLDVARIRGDFPILSRTARGKPLIYVDSLAARAFQHNGLGKGDEGAAVQTWEDLERVPGFSEGMIDDLKSGGAQLGSP